MYKIVHFNGMYQLQFNRFFSLVSYSIYIYEKGTRRVVLENYKPN